MQHQIHSSTADIMGCNANSESILASPIPSPPILPTPLLPHLPYSLTPLLPYSISTSPTPSPPLLPPSLLPHLPYSLTSHLHLTSPTPSDTKY